MKHCTSSYHRRILFIYSIHNSDFLIKKWDGNRRSIEIGKNFVTSFKLRALLSRTLSYRILVSDHMMLGKQLQRFKHDLLSTTTNSRRFLNLMLTY